MTDLSARILALFPADGAVEMTSAEIKKASNIGILHGGKVSKAIQQLCGERKLTFGRKPYSYRLVAPTQSRSVLIDEAVRRVRNGGRYQTLLIYSDLIGGRLVEKIADDYPLTISAIRREFALLSEGEGK